MTFINIGIETGIVVPPSETAALRQVMGYVSYNPEEIKPMGQRIDTCYGQLFTTGRIARSHVALYKELLVDAKSSKGHFTIGF
jgi:glycosyltransferase involved in cell wall biosynthesis